MGMYSSGGGQQTSTTQTTYTPEERWAREQIMGLGNWAMRMNLGEEGVQEGNWAQYTGPKPIGPSTETQQSWKQGQQASGQIQRNNQVAQQANDFGLSKALFANSNPYLAGHIQAAQRPLMDKFTQAGGVLSNIRNNSVSNGSFGGSRQGIAEGLASTGLMRELGDISTAMQSNAYGQGLQAQQGAIKNQAMLNMMGLMPSQISAQIGQQREGFAGNQEAYNANVREQMKNGMWEPLNNFANIVYGGSNPSTTTTASIPKQNNTGQVLGSLGTMALMAFMMSDQRLKSQIRKIGEHAKGFGIYVYKIFGRWQCGVLAQEVQKILPEAVARHPSGYLMVNYSKL